MSLLTSTLLQQLKETFRLRMTWSLGVMTLAFRVEDGFYEIHRRVPYDYDSEFQDKYQKVAVALMEGWCSIFCIWSKIRCTGGAPRVGMVPHAA
jgi:hypothetical protein